MLSFLFIKPSESEDGDYHQDRIPWQTILKVIVLLFFIPGKHRRVASPCVDGEIVVEYSGLSHDLVLFVDRKEFEFCCTKAKVTDFEEFVVFYSGRTKYKFTEVCGLILFYYDHFIGD